ncbi:hypothetical protein [Arthrobacter sp. H14]|uniref:hypothetical protein n=1 Tax=Arthrobacter sp. H14 TaxID=1312959 RepID=UPI0006866188|nr:hypothetical protein [Arthrobacter sp. H14]
MRTATGPRGPHTALMTVLRIVITAALAIDAIIHLQLAANYQLAAPGGIGQGNLFRIQAATAILAGLYVLIRGSRASYAAAALVALAAFTAVVLYRYLDIPAIGPIPAMYEPVWFFEKTLTAVTEGAAAILAIIGFALQRPPRNPHRSQRAPLAARRNSRPREGTS